MPTPAFPVALREVAQDALDRGMQTIQKNLAASVQKGRITQAEADRRFGLIKPTLAFDGFGDADIIVEAVFEDMDLKKKVFAESGQGRPAGRDPRDQHLDAGRGRHRRGDLAAAAGDRPSLLQPGAGHEAARNRSRQTDESGSDRHVAGSGEDARQGRRAGRQRLGLRRQPALLPVSARGAVAWSRKGRRVEGVDAALTEFGMAMGPFAVDDLAGIDVGWRVRQEYPQLSPPGQRAPLVADKLYEMGRYGQKTGAGWYRYEGRKPSRRSGGDETDRRDRPDRRNSRGDRSRQPNWSNGRSTHLSTKGRKCWRKASPCGRPTST